MQTVLIKIVVLHEVYITCVDFFDFCYFHHDLRSINFLIRKLLTRKCTPITENMHPTHVYLRGHLHAVQVHATNNNT
jgi:hypothetical protein